jgi:hypothetical protein
MKHTSIYVDPDDKHILSATDTKAILLGRADDRPCILHISRETYHQAMDSWLDHKADYRKRWNNEFCGVGVIAFEATLMNGRNGWLNSLTFGLIEVPDDLDDEAWTHKTQVELYHAAKFTIDMEHG